MSREELINHAGAKEPLSLIVNLDSCSRNVADPPTLPSPDSRGDRSIDPSSLHSAFASSSNSSSSSTTLFGRKYGVDERTEGRPRPGWVFHGCNIFSFIAPCRPSISASRLVAPESRELKILLSLSLSLSRFGTTVTTNCLESSG